MPQPDQEAEGRHRGDQAGPIRSDDLRYNDAEIRRDAERQGHAGGKQEPGAEGVELGRVVTRISRVLR